jgi:hypothetical protein
MTPLIQTFMPILLTCTTGVSVLLHDTHADHVASIALTPSYSSGHAYDAPLITRDQHTHTDRFAVGGSASRSIGVSPSIGPRMNDEKKYITSKKLSVTNSGSEYVWPSV